MSDVENGSEPATGIQNRWQVPSTWGSSWELAVEVGLQHFGKMWLCAVAIVLCGMAVLILWLHDIYQKHKNDACDQPLALMLRILYAMLPLHCLKREITRCIFCYNPARDGPTKPWYVKLFNGALLLATLAWPVAAGKMLLDTQSCNEDLVLAIEWVIVYYFVVAFVVFITPVCIVTVLMFLYQRRFISPPRPPTAAPAGLISQFPEVPFDTRVFDDDGEVGCLPSQCSVCLEQFDADVPIVCTLCQPTGHVFHKDCLAGWLETRRTCPICRTDLPGCFQDVEVGIELRPTRSAESPSRVDNNL